MNWLQHPIGSKYCRTKACFFQCSADISFFELQKENYICGMLNKSIMVLDKYIANQIVLWFLVETTSLAQQHRCFVASIAKQKANTKAVLCVDDCSRRNWKGVSGCLLLAIEKGTPTVLPIEQQYQLTSGSLPQSLKEGFLSFWIHMCF